MIFPRNFKLEINQYSDTHNREVQPADATFLPNVKTWGLTLVRALLIFNEEYEEVLSVFLYRYRDIWPELS